MSKTGIQKNKKTISDENTIILGYNFNFQIRKIKITLEERIFSKIDVSRLKEWLKTHPLRKKIFTSKNFLRRLIMKNFLLL